MSAPDDLYTDRFPASWYVLAESRALAPAQALPVDALGERLVLWRDEAGAAHVMDRFCPHMGASLAAGRVEGLRLRCPFHAWAFDGGGRCVAIPYMPDADIPPRARVRVWTATEHAGLIWLWHGAGPPTHALPPLPEHGDPGFGWRSRVQTFDIHPLLILENGCDAQHFKVVHKVDFRRYEVEMTRDEPHAFGFRVVQELSTPFGGSHELVTAIEYVGASTIFGALEERGRLLARFIAAPLPESARRTRFLLVVLARRLPWPLRPLDALYQRWFAGRIFDGSTDDYGPIWSQMDPSRRGVLVAEDRLQQRFRAYYRRHIERPAAPAG